MIDHLLNNTDKEIGFDGFYEDDSFNNLAV